MKKAGRECDRLSAVGDQQSEPATGTNRNPLNATSIKRVVSTKTRPSNSHAEWPARTTDGPSLFRKTTNRASRSSMQPNEQSRRYCREPPPRACTTKPHPGRKCSQRNAARRPRGEYHGLQLARDGEFWPMRLQENPHRYKRAEPCTPANTLSECAPPPISPQASFPG